VLAPRSGTSPRRSTAACAAHRAWHPVMVRTCSSSRPPDPSAG
jgi:hypothetical protein